MIVNDLSILTTCLVRGLSRVYPDGKAINMICQGIKEIVSGLDRAGQRLEPIGMSLCNHSFVYQGTPANGPPYKGAVGPD